MNISSSDAPALLNQALQRLTAQSAACKLWSVALTILPLGLLAAREGDAHLAWFAAPALLLALTDAAYAARAGRIAALGAHETVRASDLFRIQSGSSGVSAAIESLRGVASFSVWPFYTALMLILTVLTPSVATPPTAKPASPASQFKPSVIGSSSNAPKQTQPTGFSPPVAPQSQSFRAPLPQSTVYPSGSSPTPVPATKPISPPVPAPGNPKPARSNFNRTATTPQVTLPKKTSPAPNTTQPSQIPPPK